MSQLLYSQGLLLFQIGKAALGSETDLGKMRDALNKIDDAGIEEVRAELEELKGASEDARLYRLRYGSLEFSIFLLAYLVRPEHSFNFTLSLF